MKELKLTKGQIALVDDEDFELLAQWKWHVMASFRKDRITYYAVHNVGDSNKRGAQIFLHKFIMQAGKNVQVDHKNGNTLDCQKQNLRIATRSQNSANRQAPILNRLGYRGVTQSGDGFTARIHHKQDIYIGIFNTAFEAALARDFKAIEIWGEFAALNISNAQDYEPPVPRAKNRIVKQRPRSLSL